MTRFTLAAGIILAPLALCGCAATQAQTDVITTTLTQISNTAITDLQNQAKVALAATPPDVDGAQCAGTLPDPTKAGDTGTGALAVAAAIQRVAAVTTGQPVGVFTTAEIATLYQPGSAQFNWAVKTIETACIAKIHDVNQAVNSTAGIFTALPSVLALAAAPAGL